MALWVSDDEDEWEEQEPAHTAFVPSEAAPSAVKEELAHDAFALPEAAPPAFEEELAHAAFDRPGRASPSAGNDHAEELAHAAFDRPEAASPSARKEGLTHGTFDCPEAASPSAGKDVPMAYEQHVEDAAVAADSFGAGTLRAGGPASSSSAPEGRRRPAAAPGPPRLCSSGGLSASASAGSLGGRACFLTSLSQHRSLPKVTMSCRVNSVPPSLTPGPGSYDDHKVDGDRHSKYMQQPRYGFGGASRFGLGPNPTRDKPGPGAYGVPENPGKYASEPRLGFGGAPRGPAVRVRQVTAGPGQYVPKSTLTDGPSYTAQGKRYRRHVRSLLRPGPGTYDPSELMDSKFASVPKVGFGTSAREDFMAKHVTAAPGPGAYDLHKRLQLGMDSAKFSIISRRRSHDLQPYVLPGPGMYDSHGTSFGY